MLNRQRVALFMLRKAGGRASRMQLMKWLFLLRHETSSRGGDAFYQFLPYHHGPFSFCLYHEASRLGAGGLLAETDSQTWEITPLGRSTAGEPSSLMRDDVSLVLERFGHRPVEELVRYVYDRYPWFTVNSLNDARCLKPRAETAVYTAGYEGLQVDGFLNCLLGAGIQRVIDVRNNPVSRRYGFHKGTLSRLCGHVGVDYVHVPELGIPPGERKNLDGPGDRAPLFNRYERSLIASGVSAIRNVAALMAQMPSVLVCSESDPACCHRSRLAQVVAARATLPVRHLSPAA